MIIADNEIKRSNIVVLGRKLGTATGFIQENRTTFRYDDFEPAEDCIIPKCSGLYVLFSEGLMQWTDPRGELTGRGDMIFIVEDLPRIEVTDPRSCPRCGFRI